MLDKYSLANLPTPIVKLSRLSEEYGAEIYMKRDDYTGSELSGNKVRKLEYLAQDALSQGATHLITCGGIQSNHARATAMVAARLGMGVTLVLRGTEELAHEGNPFFGQMAGAHIRFITPEEYREKRGAIMEGMAEELRAKGETPYIIPEGASNARGSMGYVKAYEEILEQEKALGLTFDRLFVAVGSGGTYAGLLYGNVMHGGPLRVTGVPICDDAAYFRAIAQNLFTGLNDLCGGDVTLQPEAMPMLDGYAGLGYAISRDEELAIIHHVARKEGVITDPVYTGKALYGVLEELKQGRFQGEKILFVHTGGLMGYSSAQRAQIEPFFDGSTTL